MAHGIKRSICLITVLLGAASQRIEYLALEFIGTPWLLDILDDWRKHERGSIPGPTECCIMIFIISVYITLLHITIEKKILFVSSHYRTNLISVIISGLIWGEIINLYSSGIADYVSDLWNIIDFISNTFYVTWIGLRITSWYVVHVSFSDGFQHYIQICIVLNHLMVEIKYS